MDVRVGLIKKAECQELMLLNCGVGKDLRGPWTARRSDQSIVKEISLEYSLEGLMLSWNSNSLATRCEAMNHLKRPWFCEKLKAGGEEDDGGRNGWMGSTTQYTKVWLGSGHWWWTEKPGILQSMESQRVGDNWATELNWAEVKRTSVSLTSHCYMCRDIQNSEWSITSWSKTL